MSPQQKAAVTRERNRRARLERVQAALVLLDRDYRLARARGNHRLASYLLRKVAAAGRERHRLRWSS